MKEDSPCANSILPDKMPELQVFRISRDFILELAKRKGLPPVLCVVNENSDWYTCQNEQSYADLVESKVRRINEFVQSGIERESVLNKQIGKLEIEVSALRRRVDKLNSERTKIRKILEGA